MVALASNINLSRPMEDQVIMHLPLSSTVVILSKATPLNKVIHHKVTNRDMDLTPDMVEDMAEVDMEAVINNNKQLPRNLESVPEVPLLLVWVVV